MTCAGPPAPLHARTEGKEEPMIVFRMEDHSHITEEGITYTSWLELGVLRSPEYDWLPDKGHTLSMQIGGQDAPVQEHSETPRDGQDTNGVVCTSSESITEVQVDDVELPQADVELQDNNGVVLVDKVERGDDDGLQDTQPDALDIQFIEVKYV
jgi:hypothetical protein